jgi:ribonuclease D
MRIIKEQHELEALVRDFNDAPYLAIDTEFMRERTYWPTLCLVQIARPPADADSPQHAAIIDPIDGDLDLGPLLELMQNPKIIKVFHAARQDAEIFHYLSGAVPTPIFDTQIAAMVCGFGDQVAYETLVRKIVGDSLDKSSRFTDWSRRPLSRKQLHYALGDVTHLRSVYENLSSRIDRENRAHWVAEEMAVLSAAKTYISAPEAAWRRLKIRKTDGKFLAVAKELAAWREREAQRRNVPRNRVLKDEALLEICANQPKTVEDLSNLRLLFREGRRADVAHNILKAVARGVTAPKSAHPAPPAQATKSPEPGILALLKVLLKAKSEQIGVAQRLIASTADLEKIAVDSECAASAVLQGWRREAFGEDALKLKRGEIALSADRQGLRIIAL